MPVTTTSAQPVQAKGSEAVTEGVRVRVLPSFLPDQSDPDRGRYVFAYQVRITNESPQSVRLLSRKWRIIDANGDEKAVEGEGVVGQQPTIEPGKHFDYSSFCPLETGWGTMEGEYRLERSEGGVIEARIARFYLVST